MEKNLLGNAVSNKYILNNIEIYTLKSLMLMIQNIIKSKLLKIGGKEVLFRLWPKNIAELGLQLFRKQKL